MSYITIDRTKTYQPYFQAYIKDLKHGDVVKAHEYIAWITAKHREFRRKESLGRKPYTREQKNQFVKFINRQEDLHDKTRAIRKSYRAMGNRSTSMYGF